MPEHRYCPEDGACYVRTGEMHSAPARSDSYQDPRPVTCRWGHRNIFGGPHPACGRDCEEES